MQNVIYSFLIVQIAAERSTIRSVPLIKNATQTCLLNSCLKRAKLIPANLAITKDQDGSA